MDQRHTTSLLVLLCFTAGSSGFALDVCASCHVNATCHNKPNQSGKVCTCKYGLVGNGLSLCQDKDECQLGAMLMCGPHTTCHNTFGSYYCTCLQGYSPSNNMNVFIPNDGTHCQDVDECSVPGVCGRGALCRNLEASVECSCQPGYTVYNGPEPFHPQRDSSTCKEVSCGPPIMPYNATLWSATGTTYGQVVTLVCEDGFVWRGGDNTSVCGADGLWTMPTIVCEGVDCGSPPTLPHTHMLWDQRSRLHSKVYYECDSGYDITGGSNVSTCGAAGLWEGADLFCREIDCGIAPVMESADRLWTGHSVPGSSAEYLCKDGFRSTGGQNQSVCGLDGQWTRPTLSCQEILCGDPPVLPRAQHDVNISFTPGSAAVYRCLTGFYHDRGSDVALCTTDGYWTEPNISCSAVNCGPPPEVPHSVQLWNGTSTVGSQVLYQCASGYHSVGGTNASYCSLRGVWEQVSVQCREILCGDPPVLPHGQHDVNISFTPGSAAVYRCLTGFYHDRGSDVALCTTDGNWTEPNISCSAVNCGAPPEVPHSVQLWDGTSTVGSQVLYQCASGYHSVGGTNASYCSLRGVWEQVSVQCREIDCQQPLHKANSKRLWDGTSRLNSEVQYQCEEGFFTQGLRNYSRCGENGTWEDVDLVCEAKCGPVPVLVHSEVIWQNTSVAVHRCVSGFHSRRGHNASVCSSYGVWHRATLRCVEVQPAITHVSLAEEKCLRWRAEKYEDDTEVYKVTYFGSRDFDLTFRDSGKQFLRSKSSHVEVCLNLFPVTNYTIYISAVSASFTVSITSNTSLTVPPAPTVYYTEHETTVPTLSLRRTPHSLDSISVYEVLVLPGDDLMEFNCSALGPDSSSESSAEYIAALIHVSRVETEMNFTVGDGLWYGGVWNTPLENGRSYYVLLRVVSRWKTATTSSCVLWAKVKGTWNFLTLTSLCAAASILLVVLVALGVYACLRRRR